MKTIHIAFDVDGTLRCNCTETCRDPNQRILDLLNILQTFKNVKITVWSGGGALYAKRIGESFGITGVRFDTKNHLGVVNGEHQFAPRIKPDIAIDDIQDCELGVLNLIVREK